ncbi:hypothetical protein RYX36_025052 [Vicia faba]
MTKFHEEFWRGSLGEANHVFSTCLPKGELTILVEEQANSKVEPPSDTELESELRELIENGESLSTAVKLVTGRTSATRKTIYSLALREFDLRRSCPLLHLANHSTIRGFHRTQASRKFDDLFPIRDTAQIRPYFLQTHRPPSSQPQQQPPTDPHHMHLSCLNLIEKEREEMGFINFGDTRKCVVARKMTKFHEEFWRGSLGEANHVFSTCLPKGELTILVEEQANSKVEPPSDTELESELRELIENGESLSTAVKLVTGRTSATRKTIYSLALREFDLRRSCPLLHLANHSAIREFHRRVAGYGGRIQIDFEPEFSGETSSVQLIQLSQHKLW